MILKDQLLSIEPVLRQELSLAPMQQQPQPSSAPLHMPAAPPKSDALLAGSAMVHPPVSAAAESALQAPKATAVVSGGKLAAAEEPGCSSAPISIEDSPSPEEAEQPALKLTDMHPDADASGNAKGVETKNSPPAESSAGAAAAASIEDDASKGGADTAQLHGLKQASEPVIAVTSAAASSAPTSASATACRADKQDADVMHAASREQQVTVMHLTPAGPTASQADTTSTVLEAKLEPTAAAQPSLLL